MTDRYLHVPGAQLTTPEREWLKATAAEVTSAHARPTIVNVGIMWGASMWCLREGAPDAALYGIDIDLRHGRTLQAERIWYEDELNATLIEADSRTYTFTHPIHFLFIDGDHHYDVVQADISNWAPSVTRDGIIAFHDYAPASHNLQQFPELEGVRRAADELFSTGHWEYYGSADSIISFRKVK